uniref:Uncharacterized protein n=1 Tax=Arundo donax TaxID=35708 RepID=A0A0A9GM84_ARUDO
MLLGHGSSAGARTFPPPSSAGPGACPAPVSRWCRRAMAAARPRRSSVSSALCHPRRSLISPVLPRCVHRRRSARRRRGAA